MQAQSQALQNQTESTHTHIIPTSAINVDYTFSDMERDQLAEIIDIRVNPYQNPRKFLETIKSIANTEVPDFMQSLCDRLRRYNVADKPFYYLKNCPLDPVIPVLGFEDQLNEKYRLKKTFIAEGFLALFTELMKTDIISYRTANNGDLFQDIHPMRELAHTPSQKTVDTIKFHADIPNNKVRPDWVYLLSMRNSLKNRVFTVVVSLKKIFECLTAEDFEILRKPIFYSPTDTIHVYGGQAPGFSPKKPILLGDQGREHLVFFEGNTISDEAEGRHVIKRLSKILKDNGKDVFLSQGELIAMSNNTALHARRVDYILDEDAHRNRWLLKTWNVDDLSQHKENLIAEKVNMSDE